MFSSLSLLFFFPKWNKELKESEKEGGQVATDWANEKYPKIHLK